MVSNSLHQKIVTEKDDQPIRSVSYERELHKISSYASFVVLILGVGAVERIINIINMLV